MKQDELLERFEKEFNVLKKNLKFKTSLEELDREFYIKDNMLRAGYVPTNLLKFITKIINDALRPLGDYLHSLIIPNPHYLPSVTESRTFTDEEKEKFKKLISKIMELSSRNGINGIIHDTQSEGKFIDDSMVFWNKTLKPEIITVLKKVNTKWNEP